MKKLTVLLICFFLYGCSSIPQEAYTQPNDNSIISDAFVVKMEKGETSRLQEQAIVRAFRRAWHAQNYALNNVPIPPDMQTAGNTGPLSQNLLQALDIDLAVRKAQQDLQKSFNQGGIGSIDSTNKLTDHK